MVDCMSILSGFVKKYFMLSVNKFIDFRNPLNSTNLIIHSTFQYAGQKKSYFLHSLNSNRFRMSKPKNYIIHPLMYLFQVKHQNWSQNLSIHQKTRSKKLQKSIKFNDCIFSRHFLCQMNVVWWSIFSIDGFNKNKMNSRFWGWNIRTLKKALNFSPEKHYDWWSPIFISQPQISRIAVMEPF